MIEWYLVIIIAWMSLSTGCLIGFIFGMMGGIDSFGEGWDEE